MSYPFQADSLVKDIVNEFPKAADVFKRNRIDFCCGGNIPLDQAATEKSLDVNEIIQEIHQLFDTYSGSNEDIAVWTDSASDVIINHIIEHYHRPLEEELAHLSPYVTKVAKVHGAHRPELLKVYDLFYKLKRELLEHTAKEEELVFPMLEQLDSAIGEERNRLTNEIIDLEKEHDHAGATLKELREITSDFQPPTDACGTYRLVYKRLELLEEQTFMHVHLENNILFPRYIL